MARFPTLVFPVELSGDPRVLRFFSMLNAAGMQYNVVMKQATASQGALNANIARGIGGLLVLHQTWRMGVGILRQGIEAAGNQQVALNRLQISMHSTGAEMESFRAMATRMSDALG